MVVTALSAGTPAQRTCYGKLPSWICENWADACVSDPAVILLRHHITTPLWL